MEALEAQLAAEARRKFLGSHLTEIIICSAIFAIFVFTLTSVLCKRIPFCPMYRPKFFNTLESRHLAPSCSGHGMSSGSRYRPVDLLSSSSFTNGATRKPELVYDAPPPYEFAQQQGSSIIRSSVHPNRQSQPIQSNPPPVQRRLHDIDCLIENEVNGLRQSGSIVNVENTPRVY